jgi:hypothetical protein
MMYKLPGFISAIVAMGDNRSKWIMKIGELVDCLMAVEHGMVFGNVLYVISCLYR